MSNKQDRLLDLQLSDLSLQTALAQANVEVATSAAAAAAETVAKVSSK